MDEFTDFLRINISKRVPATLSRKYKPGVAHWEVLEAIDPSTLGAAAAARLMYVKNLVLRQPVSFKVPAELDSAERALMCCSYGAYAEALLALGLPVESEIVGVKAVGRTGAVSAVLAVKLAGTASTDTHEYSCDGLAFPDYKVEPLSHAELLHLYIKARELQSDDGEQALIRSRVLAFVNRALCGVGKPNKALRTAFLLIKTELTNEVQELEDVLKDPARHSGDIFSNPITFMFEVCTQIGRSYMATYDYHAAYEILDGYPLFDEKIDCLIAMKKPELAVREICEYISLIGNVDDRSDQILLSNLHIKLGHIYQDVKYFDMAASIFHSARPYHLKGLLFFNKKRYAESAVAFEEALKITPSSEELRFSYACTLVELGRIAEALKIFRLLKSESPQSQSISKNLSYCYYRLKDIENTLGSLKSIALHDHSAMKQFLYISIQNDRLDNVRWSLQRICFDVSIAEVVNYLVQANKIEAAELREILHKNAYLDAEQIAEIFARTG